MKKVLSIIFGVIAFIILVMFDQFTKNLAVIFLKNQDPIIIINKVFQLFYLENRGAAFGILQGQRSAFIVVTVIVMIVIAYIYCVMPNTKKFIPLRIIIVLIAAGAIGNFIDRISNAYVVDFFYFNLINFPVFNVADIYVTTSVIVLIYMILFKYKEKELSELSAAIFRKKNKEES